jgi:hypothetical protein
MSEHRPECALGDDEYFNSWMIDECICDRILAAEARVLLGAQLRVAAMRDPWPYSAPGTIKRSHAIAAIKSGGWQIT